MPNARREAPDYCLALVSMALVVIGVLVVFDATFARAGQMESLRGDPLYYVRKQAVAAAVGLVMLWVGARVPYRTWRRFGGLSVLVSVFLLLLVFAPGVGKMYGGAHRWVRLFSGVYVQPSEIAKLSMVLFFARCAAIHKEAVVRDNRLLIEQLVALGAMALPIAMEPDLGTALVLVGTWLVAAMACGLPTGRFLQIVAAGVAFVVVSCYHHPYKKARLVAFLHPFDHRDDIGYQIVHSLTAVGSGGLFGVGIAKGLQKYFYLPAAHTDFIFATLAEETGLMGSLVILFLFALFVYRGLVIARRASDPFGALVALGITATVGLQALMNIAVVTATVPTTGVPLPFVSYGGTSMVVSMFSVGILLNVSKYPAVVAREKRESHSFGGRHWGAHISRAGSR
jgi:cell division protein FtsW